LNGKAWQWAEAKAWETNVALAALGAALFWFSGQYVRESHQFWIGFSGVSSSMAVLYLVSCWLVLTQPVDKWTMRILWTVAIACNLVTIFAPPFSSTDIYRYVWDGIVQHAGINPYRYVPADKALGVVQKNYSDIYENINRKEYARTIYPPAAQWVDYLITMVSPTVTCFKAFMVLLEGLTCWALMRLLTGLGYRREQVLLYAWCPLMTWEFGGGGHLDAVAITFIVLALLYRFRDSRVLTGIFLGLAVITKIYPLILFPALYRRGDWKMPAAMVATIAAGYACYSSAGMLIFSFFGGYAKEEGLDTGARYFLLELAQKTAGLHWVSNGLFIAFCAVVFASISLWAFRVSTRPGGAFLAPGFALAFALMILFSPHYGWYIAWLIPFFCLLPNLPVATYLMAFFYGYTTWWADPGPKMFYLNKWVYGITLVAVFLHLAHRAFKPYMRGPFVSSLLPVTKADSLGT
jgi:alpha-1,6-mannosyltransferase